jgi:purine-binding chemotaxis protein CheW
MIADEEIQLVTFRIGEHTFALNVLEVERVLRYEAPSPLPKAPAFLEGMLRYGEELVPLVDFRKRLEVDAAVREETRTMILQLEQGKIGVVVDAVLELLKVPVDDINPPPPIVQGLAAEYVSGIVARDHRTLILLAVSRLLKSTERVALEELMAESSNE